MYHQDIEDIIKENQELKEYIELFKEKLAKVEAENNMLKKCLEIIVKDIKV